MIKILFTMFHLNWHLDKNMAYKKVNIIVFSIRYFICKELIRCPPGIMIRSCL